MRRPYQTDLSDAEWSYLEPHIPTPKAPGRPRVRPLRERVRVRMGRMDRDPQPSAGVVVSQSVKTTGVGGEGIRWRQEGKGHSKRHLLVDTQGLVLKAKVHSASIMDWDGIKMLLRQADVQLPRLKHLWLDSAYTGEEKGKDWVEKTLGWSVELDELVRKSPHPKRSLRCGQRSGPKRG
jgi:transposase